MRREPEAILTLSTSVDSAKSAGLQRGTREWLYGANRLAAQLAAVLPAPLQDPPQFPHGGIGDHRDAFTTVWEWKYLGQVHNSGLPQSKCSV